MPGYGQSPYGDSSYGSVFGEVSVLGASSINGFQVEVVFSSEVNTTTAGDINNYTLASVYGVDTPIESVEVGTDSIVLTHTGSTLGGVSTLVVQGIRSIDDIEFPAFNTVLLMQGDITSVVVDPSEDARSIHVRFFRSDSTTPQGMVSNPALTSPVTYPITTDYIIPPVVGLPSINAEDGSEVTIPFLRQTNATYLLVANPGDAIIYGAEVLPNEVPGFDAFEIGEGLSEITPQGLSISRPVGVLPYGWVFQDTSSRITSDAAIRVDITGSGESPPVGLLPGEAWATYILSTGVVEIELRLALSLASNQVLRVVSGGDVLAEIPTTWQGDFAYSIIRNPLAGIYTVLIEGTPVWTQDLDSIQGPATHPPGMVLSVIGSHPVQGLLTSSMNVRATSTLYSSAWNFLQSVVVMFTGSTANATTSLLTQYGPLVKGWGDMTPATKSDVVLRVNSVEVGVQYVNPYNGEIFPEIAIPRLPEGEIDVELDYTWMPAPVFPLVSNIRGSNSNTWTPISGHTPGATSPTSVGASPRNRFPMGVVSNRWVAPKPLQLGYSYYGYQRAYSALSNNYTSLRSNQNPNAIQNGLLVSKSDPQTASFEGNSSPAADTPPWILEGNDSGRALGNGFYRVEASGAATYTQEVNTSRQSHLDVAARLLLRGYTPDGVFTGLGFGGHDNHSLVLVGFVVVDGVRSVGLLNNPSYPNLESSWTLGPSFGASATSQTTIQTAFNSVLLGLRSGDRIRIPSGVQAGVYHITSCGVVQLGGTVQISITPSLPVEVHSFGARDVQFLVDIPFDDFDTTYRLQTSFPNPSVVVFIGGRLSGVAIESSSVPAYTAQTALVIPTRETGAVFWGALDRNTVSTSDWNFFRYVSTPLTRTSTSTGIHVDADMSELPQNSPHPWYITENFGSSSIVSPGVLRLASNRGSADLDLQFGYARLEPFLSSKGVVTDVMTSFRVDTGVAGAGDASIRIRNGRNEIEVVTIRYAELNTRFMYDLGYTSLSCIRPPELDGWTPHQNNGVIPRTEVQRLILTKSPTHQGTWVSEVPEVTPSVLKGEGAFFSAQILVRDVTFVGGGSGFGVGFLVPGVVPNTRRNIQVRWVSTGLSFNTAIPLTLPFAWNDGAFHAYHIVIDPVAMSISVSVDSVPIGVVPMGGLPLEQGHVLEASILQTGGAANTTEIDGLSISHLRAYHPSAVFGKTLGVRTRFDSGIDAYRIPRSDLTTSPNSSLDAVVIPMDWGSSLDIRIRVDPQWGVSVYRPDLPPPPGSIPPEFVSTTTAPNAAWINVETSDLPVKALIRPEVPSIAWGALNPNTVTQHIWGGFSYRLLGTPNGAYIAPQGMVSNRYTAFTSGEFNIDNTPEVVDIISSTSTTISVWDSNINASRVFVVEASGVVVPSDAWRFDVTSQIITLSTPLPSEQFPVRITFAVGKPVTATYLCGQPLGEVVTVLNSGTPIVPLGHTRPESRVVVPNPPYGDEIEFVAGEESRIVDLSVCTRTDGVDIPLTTPCDGPSPGHGFAELTIRGPAFTDTRATPGGMGGYFGNRSPSPRGSASHFDGVGLVFGFTATRLNTNPLQPNARGVTGGTPPPGMGMNQDYRITGRISYNDSVSGITDNTPPSLGDGSDPDPDGTPSPFGNGACVVFATESNTSIFGPLPGLSGQVVLSQRSLLGGGIPSQQGIFTMIGGVQIGVVNTTIPINAAS
jgi:hypothetical protein